MSDEGQQEPSMEDILASIRKILSEDEEGGEEGDAAEAAPEEASAPEPEPVIEPEPEPEPVSEPKEDDGPDLAALLAEDDDEPAPPPVAELGAIELTDSMLIEEEGQEQAIGEPVSEPGPAPIPPPPPQPQDVAQPGYQLYGQNGLVADQVEQASGTHIAQLAQAVAQERALTLGNQGITLEQLVREICTPVLKQWLDHNLPYMVERIVRQEIERIVSRSERT